MTTIQAPESYPFHKTEGLRYSDTDRQGHVNNAVFATLLESGRVGIIYENGLSIAATGCAFVIARVEIDFRAELTWPGTVDVATAVTRIGRSSVELSQALFQNNRCAALSRSVVVQMNEATRRSHELEEPARRSLGQWMIKANLTEGGAAVPA